MAIARNVLVLIADKTPDATGEVLERDGIGFPDEAVPVRDGYGCVFNHLGTAKLRWGEDGKLLADIDFHGPHTQVDLLAKMTPAFSGVLLEHEKDGAFIIIKKCQLRSVLLTFAPNLDPRIKTLGEQGVFEAAQ